MKKIFAIFTLIVMSIVLASCNGNKEGSEAEERGENAQVEAAEKAKATTETKEAPMVEKSKTKKTTATSKTEDQVVKDFEKELDGLFKLLESSSNATK